MITQKIVFLAAFVLVSSCTSQSQESDTSTKKTDLFDKSLEECGIDDAEHDRLLRLSQDDFDQDFKGGWRVYSYKEGCKNASAELIKDYILFSQPHPPNSHGILRWHAGQLKAGSGRTKEAIQFFRGTYKDLDDHGETWNLYVDATIGFLENDKDKVQYVYDRLSAIEVPETLKEQRRQFLKNNPDITMPEGFVDEPQNLSVVRRLLKCFGQPYSEAYGDCEKR